MTVRVLFLAAAVPIIGSAKAGPADDLLPPPVRQAEKRSLGANDERMKRSYYDGRGVGGAAFSPDGRVLVASSGYQGMTLWDVASGRAVALPPPTPNNNSAAVAAFLPDGKQFVAASSGGPGREMSPVGLWDVAKRERIRSLDEDCNDTSISALAVAPDGKTVALAAGFGRRNEAPYICFWDVGAGDEIGRADGLVTVDPMRRVVGGGLFQALAYSPDGRTLAVLGDGRIHLVEAATGKPRGQFAFNAGASRAEMQNQNFTFGALAFSADGRILLAGCPDGAVRRFELRSATELTPLPGHTGPVLALCCTPDGKSIHSFGADGQFFVWRADAGRDWKPKAGPLSDASLAALWEVLRGDDPLDVFGCTQALAAAPDQALPFLRKQLAPAPKGDAERIDKLILEVQKGEYNARKKAVVELRKIGPAAGPALQQSQQKGGYDPMLQRLMFEFSNMAPSPEQMRGVRALAVLERIGDAESRKFLEELAGGAPGAPLTTEAKAVLDRLGEAKPEKTAPDPQALWDALAVDDGAAAYSAIRSLAGQPKTAALLRDRLKEASAKDTFDDDPQRVSKLIGDLDNDDFAVREQATKDLRNLGRLVVPTLKKALEAKPSDEAKQRLEQLVEKAATTPPPPVVLRVGRALEALEMAGGPEAREALEALAKDAKIKWMREAAGETLRRAEGVAKKDK
jgi:hypothetical protein